MNKLYIFCVVMLSGCAFTPDFKVQSDWQVLKDVQSVECELWPVPGRGLGMNQLTVLPDSPATVISDLRSRRGAQEHYFTQVGDKWPVKSEDFQRLSFRPGTLIAGGGRTAKGEAFLVSVESDRKKRTSKVEVRWVKDNVVQYQSPDLKGFIGEARAINTPTGLWLVYRVLEPKKSLDDASFRFGFLSYPKEGETLAWKSLSLALKTDEVELIPFADGSQARVFWTSGEKNPSFANITIGVDGKASKPERLPVKVSKEVESWSLSAYSNGVVLAWVDGDSLVGEADLAMGFIGFGVSGPVLNWQKTVALPNTRIARPLWQTMGKDIFLVFPEWLDHERTLGVIRVNEAGYQMQRPAGVFRRGMTVTGSFLDDDGEDLFVITRTKASYGWLYRVCEMESL